MKMTYEDFTSSTFLIRFCVNGTDQGEVTIRPIFDDEWATTSVNDKYYDVNLWLDDWKSEESPIVRFGVYSLSYSKDGMLITDSKMACSSDCPDAVIQIVNC
jgi:hypothetical protein